MGPPGGNREETSGRLAFLVTGIYDNFFLQMARDVGVCSCCRRRGSEVALPSRLFETRNALHYVLLSFCIFLLFFLYSLFPRMCRHRRKRATYMRIRTRPLQVIWHPGYVFCVANERLRRKSRWEVRAKIVWFRNTRTVSVIKRRRALSACFAYTVLRTPRLTSSE